MHIWGSLPCSQKLISPHTCSIWICVNAIYIPWKQLVLAAPKTSAWWQVRNLFSRACVVAWLRRISPWVTCFRFIHPYAMRSYVCARSTAQFSPLSCLSCHQGNNRILETIISTCKRLHTQTHTHTHTNLNYIFSSVTTSSTQHFAFRPLLFWWNPLF